jgi:pyruvate kinase
VACHRPQIPLLALSSSQESQRRLTLTWGVESYTVEPIQNTQHMVELALTQAVHSGVAVPGDIVVIAAGTPYGTAGRTNMLKIEEIPEGLTAPRGSDD